MKKQYLALLITVLAIFLAGCGNDSGGSGTDPDKETVSIKHELDEEEVVVEKNPETIVVFDFGMLDTLDKMDIKVTGVPKSGAIPPYLSKYEGNQYENVGSLKEPDFEKIAEIGPDLIIISGRQAELYEDFKEIAPTVYLALDTSNYIESFKSNVKTIGKIFEHEDMIDAELAKIDEQIASVNEKASSLGKNALIVLANDGKISAYGPGSRFGLIHDVLGFEPTDPGIEASTHGQSISFEYILEKNPDYLFVIDRTAVVGGETTASEVIENELIENTNAYKDNNIYYLDPNYWYLSGGGLISVSEMIKQIEAAIE